MYSNLAQLHQFWQNWLQGRPAAIVTRLDAHRRDVESSVKVSSEGGRHQTTPYCRNRRRHCARAGSSARVRVHRAVYTRCRAVAPAPPASTISQAFSSSSRDVAEGGFRDVVVLKSGVAAVSCGSLRCCRRRAPRALHRRTRSWLDSDVTANFRQSSGCIEIKFCSSYPHSFVGARFTISLARSERILYTKGFVLSSRVIGCAVRIFLSLLLVLRKQSSLQ